MKSLLHDFTFVFRGDGRMKISKIIGLIILTLMFAVASKSEALAGPNCPPQYTNICKQLIKILEQNNNGKFNYTWDGTHLFVDTNFAVFTFINNNPTRANPTSGDRPQVDAIQMLLHQDSFDSILQQTIKASQGSQRVYLHLLQLGGPTVDAGLSNQALAQPSTKGARAQSQKVMVSQSTAATNSPSSISVMTGVKAHNGKKIDKHNVNNHFVTSNAGDHIEREERAYLVDSDDKLWSCNISGLGARRMPNQTGEMEIAGHVETLQFRSVHISHVPGNHPMHSGCLISVHK